MDLFLIFIGYGYLGYNFKIFELKVKVFDWKLRWVENFVVWICNNCVLFKNILQFIGKLVEWVDCVYVVFQKEGIVGLNCFMQYGVFGVFGIVMIIYGLVLLVMLQGGLFKFFMDIGYFVEQIFLEQRIEYGIIMDIIRQDFFQKGLLDFC